MKKLVLLVLTLAFAVQLQAQNDLYANINLQFRFDNPGARAQSMGGAFIGLADDTTAIFANPAGLAIQSRATIIAEASHATRDNEIPFYAGTITRTGLQDFNFDLQSRDFESSTTSIPFVAYVQPTKRLKWGVFYAEQANFERSFDTQGIGVPPYRGQTYTVNSPLFAYFPSQNQVDLKMRTLGVSLAGQVSNWMSVGITLGYNQLDYQAESTLVQPDLEALFEPGLIPGPVLDFFEPHIGKPLNRVRTDGDDQQASVFAGVLFTPGPNFSLGIAYKSQPKFDYDHFVQDSQDFELLEPVAGSGEFNVPDSYGMGLSFRPTDLFILSVEARRVLYSDLVDPLTNFYQFQGDSSGRTQTVNDVTQYHVGFEYLFVNVSVPISLRLGYWFEPYHALVNDYLDTQLIFGFEDDSNDFVQGIRATGFLRQFEQDQNHITFGLGLSFGRNWVIDASADIAEANAQYALSSIYRF